MDYYKILGISEQADEEQIKQAYRRLAKKFHPDLNPGSGEAEERFKEVVEAYETLGDAEKRKAYDLKREKRGAGSRQSGKTHDGAPHQDIDFGNFTRDMEKYFGFSFTGGTSGEGKKEEGGGKRNPLDVTEMFEAFMRMK